MAFQPTRSLERDNHTDYTPLVKPSVSDGLNERCPLQAQCEQRCAYQGHEADCPYYAKFAADDYRIEGQETRRNNTAPAGHECVTGWNPSGICGAASYCTESRNCCMGCPNPCNIHCGFVTEHEAEDVSTARDADAVSLPIDMIPIDLLTPHPDNPRKNLGDLTELAENIRANGVLQNLTVVPMPDNSAAFRVVIGHRRLAAAKLAGLTELPCVIADRMTPEEQVAVMLSENIQRNALTPYEEAKGFEQLQIDFGKSPKEIAEIAGFSETTVRRRLRLLELDAEKFKASEKRGATLSDYMELDKIESPELKNEVLDKIGTPDFKNALKSALDNEKNRKIVERWAAEAGAFATRVENVDYDAMKHIRNYSVYGNKKDSVERPKDAGEVAYFFKTDNYNLTLYRAKDQKDKEEEAATQAAREQARQAAREMDDTLRDITKRHFALRKEFVSSVSLKNADFPKVMRYASDILIGDGRYHNGADMELLAELLELDTPDENEDFETVKKRFLPDFNDTTVTKEARLMLCAAYANADDERESYWASKWDSARKADMHVHCANRNLDALYELLTALGYEMSEEEKQMRDGTHELLKPAEKS